MLQKRSYGQHLYNVAQHGNVQNITDELKSQSTQKIEPLRNLPSRMSVVRCDGRSELLFVLGNETFKFSAPYQCQGYMRCGHKFTHIDTRAPERASTNDTTLTNSLQLFLIFFRSKLQNSNFAAKQDFSALQEMKATR